MALFTKPSRAGRVKTRLVGDLSAEQAAELHAAFLGDLTDALTSPRFDLAFAWALDVGEEAPASPLLSVRQRGQDLGERLANGLLELAVDRPSVAAVGSDSPQLRRERLDEAFAALDAGADVCLGPSEDGGYYLIAVRRAALDPRLFAGIAWSTDAVYAQTLAACKALALRVAVLPRERDVDTAQDLLWLADTLARDPRGCPRTRALLTLWGRLETVHA